MKHLKRLSIVFAILLVFLYRSQAQDFVYTRTNGTVTIIGLTIPSAVVGALSIPSTIYGLPVTAIGDRAFLLSGITSVTVPDSVTNIGINAFSHCDSLTSIEVGPLNQMYSTANGVLFDKLQTTLIQYPGGKPGVYSIPESVTNIAEGAFASCDGLKSITIPPSVTAIPRYAMSLCQNLTNVTIPDTVTSIGDMAFSGCSRLARINIPDSVTAIGFSVFDSCPVTEVTIPDTVTSIGAMAFSRCAKLTRIKLPNGLTNIAGQTFQWCASLTNIILPGSVTNIAVQAFSECTHLTALYAEGNAPAVNYSAFNDWEGQPPPYDWDPVTIYYLPGSLGWSNTLAGRPTALWLPNADTSSTTFGVRSNLFGFTINWASGRDVVVEASTNLGSAVWSPVSTNTLSSGSAYFGDPHWMNYPRRFYRVRSP